MEKIIILVIVIIVTIIIINIITTVNIFAVKSKLIEQNKSLVDIYLKKRYDLIPNLVEVCKEYSQYEKDTLDKITLLRSSFTDYPSQEIGNELNNVYNQLIGLIENYPQIKLNENYLKLQEELANVENEIQASRRIYINSITNYNNLIIKFPSSLVANIFKYKQVPLPEFDYDNVKINIK